MKVKVFNHRKLGALWRYLLAVRRTAMIVMSRRNADGIVRGMCEEARRRVADKEAAS